MSFRKPKTRKGEYIKCSAASESYKAFIPQALPPNPPLNLNTLHQPLTEAIQALSRLDARAELLPNRDLFIYMFVRKEAVVSSQIEGTQSSLSDLLLLESEEQTKSAVDDIEEVCNYIAALHMGMEKMTSSLPLSSRLLKECHRVLLKGTSGKGKDPGNFRKSQNWIGGASPSKALYVPPPHEYIEALISDLEKYIHTQDDPTPPLLKAALAHVQFETIHPFLDGNGRVGRLLIILILKQFKLIRYPVLYLSLFFKEHRQLYYNHLQNIRLNGDWENWCQFFLDGIISAASLAENEIRKITHLIEKDREKIETLGRARINTAKIFNYLLQYPYTSIARASKITGLSVPATTRNLKHLENLNIVREITGMGKNRIYEYQNYLKILSVDMEPL